jgi:hypothetical protein
MVTNFYPPDIVVRVRRNNWYASNFKVSHKIEITGPFSNGDTIINKTFSFTFYLVCNKCFQKRQVLEVILYLMCHGSGEKMHILLTLWHLAANWDCDWIYLRVKFTMLCNLKKMRMNFNIVPVKYLTLKNFTI